MNAKQLLQTIKPLLPAVGNPLLPICDYIAIRSKKATATTLSLTITVNCDLPDMLLPYKETVSILGALGNSEIETENKKGLLSIKSGKDVFKLGKSESLENFPVAPVNNGESYPVSKDFFYAMQMAARNETHNELMVYHGICVRPEYIVGTDGHTVYKQDISTGIPESHLPSSIASICAGWQSGTVRTDGKHFTITSDTIEVDILQIDQKYPDIDAIVPEKIKANVSIDRNEIEQALSKVQVFEKGIIKLTFTPGNIDFYYIKKETEYEAIASAPATHELTLEYGLNSALLSRILSCLPDSCDTIEMEVRDATKAIYIIYDTIKLLIMPVHLV